MTTTLELPDDLVRALECRAQQDGRKFDDAVADLLRKGLAASPPARPQTAARGSARIKQDPATGLPVILGNPDAPASKMTTRELLDLYQATQLREDLERLGLSS